MAYKSNAKLLTLSRHGAMKALPITSGLTVSDNKRNDTHTHTHTQTLTRPHTYSDRYSKFLHLFSISLLLLLGSGYKFV